MDSCIMKRQEIYWLRHLGSLVRANYLGTSYALCGAQFNVFGWKGALFSQ